MICHVVREGVWKSAEGPLVFANPNADLYWTEQLTSSGDTLDREIAWRGWTSGRRFDAFAQRMRARRKGLKR